MARLIVVRHGDTFAPGEPVRRIGARTDLPLVASGRAQADALWQEFSNEPLHRILAGPLLRTRETASLLARERPVTIADWLAEIDHGPDEGQPEAAVIARVGADALARWDEAAETPPGWLVDAPALVQAWREALALPGTTLAVTSNGVARFALMAAGERPAKLRTGAYGVIENGAVIAWDVRPPRQ